MTPVPKPIKQKKISKVQVWAMARDKLKQEYLEKGITACEMRLGGCLNNNFLGFAHRYKRNDSRCEHTFQKTVLACVSCHEKVEYNRELSENIFTTLRGQA